MRHHTTILEYARCARERCTVDTRCALCEGHPPPCYLTEWLFEPLRSELIAAQKS